MLFSLFEGRIFWDHAYYNYLHHSYQIFNLRPLVETSVLISCYKYSSICISIREVVNKFKILCDLKKNIMLNNKMNFMKNTLNSQKD